MLVTLGWIWTQETFEQRLKDNPYLIHWTGNGRPRYKIYADEYAGYPLGDMWADINYLSAGDSQRLGYPHKKPEALLERIVKTSSNEGGLVADFFCGSGTIAAVAEKLKPSLGLHRPRQVCHPHHPQTHAWRTARVKKKKTKTTAPLKS